MANSPLIDCELDWSERLLHLSIMVAIIILCAMFVWFLCYWTTKNYGDDDDGLIQPARRNSRWPTIASDEIPRGVDNTWALSADDLLIASATCSVPLSKLAENKQEVIIKVGQSLIVDENIEQIDCVACDEYQYRWIQAQTIVNVLVGKKKYEQKKGPTTD